MVNREYLLALLEAGKVEEAMTELRPKRRGRAGCWPWRDLEVGESFVADGAKLLSMRAMASRAGLQHGRRFRVVIAENGCEIFRVA